MTTPAACTPSCASALPATLRGPAIVASPVPCRSRAAVRDSPPLSPRGRCLLARPGRNQRARADRLPPYESPMTRPTSRTTLFAFSFPKVMICATRRSPYFCRTYSSTSPRRASQKSTSISGGETRSGFRKRSKDQSELQGIDVGNAEDVRRPANRRGAAARPDRNPALLREMNEVPDDQEVADEPGLLEDADFVIEPLDQLRIRQGALPIAIAQTGGTKLAQIEFAGLAFGRRVIQDASRRRTPTRDEYGRRFPSVFVIASG